MYVCITKICNFSSKLSVCITAQFQTMLAFKTYFSNMIMFSTFYKSPYKSLSHLEKLA